MASSTVSFPKIPKSIQGHNKFENPNYSSDYRLSSPIERFATLTDTPKTKNLLV